MMLSTLIAYILCAMALPALSAPIGSDHTALEKRGPPLHLGPGPVGFPVGSIPTLPASSTAGKSTKRDP